MIPLLYLLYFYAFFALLGLLFLFFNVYHMAKFGLQNGKTYFFITLFLALFFSCLFASFLFIVQIDWSSSIAFSDITDSLFTNLGTFSLPSTPSL